MASAQLKNCPWKSKNRIEGNHFERLIPKKEPLNRPNTIVETAHSVANHAACRIIPSLLLRSIHSPSSSNTSP